MRDPEISADFHNALTEALVYQHKTALELTVNSWPEKFPTHGIHGWYMMRLNIAIIN